MGQLRNTASIARIRSPTSIKERTTHHSSTHDEQLLIETPFVIVGAGPVGTTLSLLLGRFHVPHILIDQRPSIDIIKNAPPQAHFLSNRSMESKLSIELAIYPSTLFFSFSLFGTYRQSHHSGISPPSILEKIFIHNIS